jgi:DNA invertase Pin-like site-specific DNA recombinase
MANGEADVLVVSKLDRLSRSLIDFAQTMATAQREGWALVALDLGVDTATPGGEMMANVLASFAHASSASAPATAWRRRRPPG